MLEWVHNTEPLRIVLTGRYSGFSEYDSLLFHLNTCDLIAQVQRSAAHLRTLFVVCGTFLFRVAILQLPSVLCVRGVARGADSDPYATRYKALNLQSNTKEIRKYYQKLTKPEMLNPDVCGQQDRQPCLKRRTHADAIICM